MTLGNAFRRPSLPPAVGGRSQRHGFTLIELLVSITIIAVLIGLLIPMVMKGRIYANRSICMSNMRQIGMMTMQYCDNNDGGFPAIFPNHPSDAGSLYGATDQLQAYLPESGYRVYLCPASLGKPLLYNDTDPMAIQGGAYAWNGGRQGCSYSWNAHLRAQKPNLDWWDTGGGTAAASPINYSQIENPSITVWITDSSSARLDRFYYGLFFISAYRHGGRIPSLTGSWPYPELIDKPGANGFNLLMADGHAKWMPWSINWWDNDNIAFQ
ncbi:MAG: prepilin-type N-terminal cleavage/methylation domain-containing protein [Planctomycetes bacterium]|nr:prepilin-type N-terminal cleavage/methylation domain-containing protein [Planctomycetota bacterium]